MAQVSRVAFDSGVSWWNCITITVLQGRVGNGYRHLLSQHHDADPLGFSAGKLVPYL
jgi:hypothetical protein